MAKTGKRFEATRGNVWADGATKAEAKANLAATVDWYCSARPGPLVESRFGFILVIAATPNGIESRVIDPAGAEHGKRFDSCTLHSERHFGTVLNSARMHAAQLAWRADIADDSAFVASAGLPDEKAEELARWIQFQRRYAEFAAAGHNAADCHRMACAA